MTLPRTERQKIYPEIRNLDRQKKLVTLARGDSEARSARAPGLRCARAKAIAGPLNSLNALCVTLYSTSIYLWLFFIRCVNQSMTLHVIEGKNLPLHIKKLFDQVKFRKQCTYNYCFSYFMVLHFFSWEKLKYVNGAEINKRKFKIFRININRSEKKNIYFLLCRI